MRILVGSTAAGHKGAEANHWLARAEEMRSVTPHEVDFFLAAETRPDGLEPRLQALEAKVHGLGGTVWHFMVDDGASCIDGSNRLVRICEGRNLVIEHALRSGAEWVLFVDADIALPDDVLVRLLEMEHPFCGYSVPSYVLSGPTVEGFEFPVQAYMNTAGAWFVHRSLFRRFRWLWDPDDGLTDDPATHRVIQQQLHVEQYNRLDVVGHHAPLVAFEHRSADRSVHRHPLQAHPVVAVVPAFFPTHAHVTMTEQILRALLDECCARVILVNNGGVDPWIERATARWTALAEEAGPRFQVMDGAGMNIHQMWNAGWQAALHDFGDQVLVAFANNDVIFRPGTLELLAKSVLPNESWISYPDPAARVADGVCLTGRSRATRGSKRHGGMTGHLFLIKGGIHTLGGLAMFDERFHWWYGDDDFAFRVERAGFQQLCVEGLPCDHVNEATIPYRPEWAARRDADRELFIALWGDV